MGRALRANGVPSQRVKLGIQPNRLGTLSVRAEATESLVKRRRSLV